jgi:hypothetical protein
MTYEPSGEQAGDQVKPGRWPGLAVVIFAVAGAVNVLNRRRNRPGSAG